MNKEDRQKLINLYKRLRKEGKRKEDIIGKIADEIWFCKGSLDIPDTTEEATRIFEQEVKKEKGGDENEIYKVTKKEAIEKV